ncbi:hypothetical protein B0H34DRAFT_634206, partial [Crassisporium funariophilum]
TPSKRMRSLYAGLGATASGSFLVSKDPIMSATPIIPPVLEAVPRSIPQPNWSLATKTPVKTWQSRESLMLENEILRQHLQQAHTHVHARDLIIEGAHAQLVVQNLHLGKTMQALNKRENKKKNDRSLLFNGKAQVLSSDEFTAQVLAQTSRREEEAATRKKNAEARVAKKSAQDTIENEWKRIKANHEKDVEAWQLECQRLTDAGVLKRNWPKKPVRARK